MRHWEGRTSSCELGSPGKKQKRRSWLELVEYSETQAQTQKELVQEATELLKILSAIISKAEQQLGLVWDLIF
jgi:hypothetical protein